MTSHNRRALTMRTLQALKELTGLQIKVFLVDDGSKDGTFEDVSTFFPDTELIRGDGNLYWAAGMKLAESTALSYSRSSKFFLLLNDDAELYVDKLQNMLETALRRRVNFVGQLIDSQTGEIIYGGLKKVGRHPLNFKIVDMTNKEWKPDVFHGNVALISREDFLTVGGLDDRFEHAFADFDLALKLEARGIDVLVYPEAVGQVEANNAKLIQKMGSRFRFLFSPKGRPIQSQYYFLRKHGNSALMSAVFTISPYLRATIKKYV